MTRMRCASALGVLGLVAVAACGDTPLELPAPQVAQVEVTPSTAVVMVGDTLELLAVPRTEEGVPVAAPVAWALGNGAGATVLLEGSRARVVALEAGTVRVTATAGGHTGGSVIQVQPVPLR